ncbi:hypothetical protein C0993_009276 [Termitomyces sp. T159_Od127]|nr:hypothetical protein C0993_009276 [Termitomyces sp. T159_Od127]
MSRGVTMSPRIQVYKAIACRALNAEEDLNHSSLLTAAVDCSSAAVQARAAKIQACTSISQRSLVRFTHPPFSCRDADERTQCHCDRLLE